MKRSRIKQKLPAKNRAEHIADREDYLFANYTCEWPDCNEPATQVDHIVPKSGDSYEHLFNYFGTCSPHHDRKHTNNKVFILCQIAVKFQKGEWFADAREELAFFGRTYLYDGSGC